MIVQSFSSGSSGNALLLRAGGRAVLVDCGLGPRTLKQAMHAHRLTPTELNAILITHEHDDHVRGLQPLIAMRRPMHATEGTATALGLHGAQCERLEIGVEHEIGGLSITPITTSHDAAEPCGYSFFDGSTRMTLLTDLGETDDCAIPFLAASDLIVIEANHDLQMLRSGPYPPHLKARVQSARGHLSNDDCGAFLSRAIGASRTARTVWLAHLSATNNRPELAVRTVRLALGGSRAAHGVVALPRRQSGPIWTPEYREVPEQLSLFG